MEIENGKGSYRLLLPGLSELVSPVNGWQFFQVPAAGVWRAARFF
jgi:hypothetical protein